MIECAKHITLHVVTKKHFLIVLKFYCRYIKYTGEVYVQTKLSRLRPSYISAKVESQNKVTLQKIACHKEVVWGLTTDNSVVIREGISAHCSVGTSWLVAEGYVLAVIVFQYILFKA